METVIIIIGMLVFIGLITLDLLGHAKLFEKLEKTDTPSPIRVMLHICIDMVIICIAAFLIKICFL